MLPPEQHLTDLVNTKLIVMIRRLLTGFEMHKLVRGKLVNDWGFDVPVALLADD